MRLLAIIFTLIISIPLMSQEKITIDELDNQKHELIIEKERIQSAIDSIEQLISSLEAKNIELIESGEVALCETKVKMEAKIRNSPGIFGDILTTLSKGTKLDVYTIEDGYWLIKVNEIEGYTNEMYLKITKEMEELKEVVHARNKAQFEANNQNELIKKYGEVDAKRILNHLIWMGMTREMARESIGEPDDINKTTGSWGVHEQWVYDNKYLYFENGKLTSYQD